MKKFNKIISVLSIIVILLLLTNITAFGKSTTTVSWSDGTLYSQFIVDASEDAPSSLDILSVRYYSDSIHHFFYIETNGTVAIDADTTFGIIISNNANDSSYEYAISTTTDSTTLGIYNWIGTWMTLDTPVNHVRLNNDSVGFGVEFAVDVGDIPFDSADYFKAVVSNGPSGGNAFAQVIGVWRNNNDPSTPVSFYCYDYTSDGNIGIIVNEFSNIGWIVICGTLLVSVGIIVRKKKKI